MTNELSPSIDPFHTLELAGQAANTQAALAAFADYRSRRATNTLRRQDTDLALFAAYLQEVGVAEAPNGETLATDPASWRGVTWGLVAGFMRWMLRKGYAVSSCNVGLSTVRAYCTLAAQAGTFSLEELALVRTIGGHSKKETRRIDERRQVTRLNTKKAQPVAITPAQAQRLKKQPDTPQGRRDAVLMHLLLDHGLRVSEVAGLMVTDVDLQAGQMTFFRAKVDLTQTHQLTTGTRTALQRYIEAGDAPAIGPLLRASAGSDRLTHAGMGVRSLTQRVRILGENIGLSGLSAHDCRHYWATQAAKSGTPMDRLQQAGGWSSYAMPMRYIRQAAIANEGVRLAE